MLTGYSNVVVPGTNKALFLSKSINREELKIIMHDGKKRFERAS